MSVMASCRGVVLLLVCALGAAPAVAQWSEDPAHNLVVSDRAGYQARPQIAATADGGFYIAWEDPASPVRVQRLDAAGREVWPHNGVTVGAGAVALAVLTVDANQNAVVAAWSATGTALVKLAPDGNFPWQEGGVAVSATVDRVVGTSDGGVVCVWSEGRGFRLQKFDAAGAPQWGNGVAIELLAPFLGKEPRLVAADAGGVIVAWVADGYPTTTATGVAQKFDADGKPLWGKGEPVAWSAAWNNVMDVTVLADGDGGMVAGWVDGDVGSADPLVVRIQRLRHDGAAQFAAGGLAAVDPARRGARRPALAYAPASDAIHVVWAERSGNPVAVYAQRLDADGTRVWGEGGKELQSSAENAYTNALFALPAPDGVLAAWAGYGLQGGAPPQLTVVGLDAQGRPLFPGERVGLKRTATVIRDSAAALGAAGYAAFAWSDRTSEGPGSDCDLLAQNIRFDGTLGNPPSNDTLFADGFDGAPASPSGT